MAFNNVFFIFLFLPLALVLYRYIPNQLVKNIILLIFSYIFYAWSNPFNLLLILIMTCLNFIIVKDWEYKSDKKVTSSFILTIILNVFILFTYRYANQVIDLVDQYFELSIENVELAYPIGLSFYVFSTISYMADVYRGKCYVQESFVDYALYVSFFGKVGSGPIVQYADMEEQIVNHPMTVPLLSKGSSKFIRGLVKKVIFADQLGILVANLSNNQTMLGTWLLAVGFMLQLYFDFSGYSDMAIGIANLFGFDWKENFDHPYMATSLKEFWRKWHISLYAWFRDYIYIPLGGSKVSNILYIQTMMLIWILTGIWHGANLTFLIWGVYFGILLIVERFFTHKLLEKKPKFARVYTLLLVLFGWVIFMSKDIYAAMNTFTCMFGFGKGFIDGPSLFNLRSYFIILVLSVIFCTDMYSKIETKIITKYRGRSILINLLLYFALFIVCIACIIGSTYQPFLYFAF